MTQANETWLIEAGDKIIEKKANASFDSLTTLEQLVYFLWVADYGMRNAGSLDTANDIHADFQSNGLRAAKSLALPLTITAFSLESDALEAEYFDRFDAICEEIKHAGKVQSLQASTAGPSSEELEGE